MDKLYYRAKKKLFKEASEFMDELDKVSEEELMKKSIEEMK